MDLNRHSEALAYGIRAGVSIALVYFIYQFFYLSHGYWALVTTCLVLQFQTGSLFKRTFERALGQTLGLPLLFLIAACWFYYPLPMLWVPFIVAGSLIFLPFQYLYASLFIISLAASINAFVPPYSIPGMDIFTFGMNRLFDILIGGLIPMGVTLILFPQDSFDDFLKGIQKVQKLFSEYLVLLTDRPGVNSEKKILALQKAIQKQIQANQDQWILVRYQEFNLPRYQKEFAWHQKQQRLFGIFKDVGIPLPVDHLSEAELEVQQALRARLVVTAQKFEKDMPVTEAPTVSLQSLAKLMDQDLLNYARYLYYFSVTHLLESVEERYTV